MNTFSKILCASAVVGFLGFSGVTQPASATQSSASKPVIAQTKANQPVKANKMNERTTSKQELEKALRDLNQSRSIVEHVRDFDGNRQKTLGVINESIKDVEAAIKASKH